MKDPPPAESQPKYIRHTAYIRQILRHLVAQHDVWQCTIYVCVIHKIQQGKMSVTIGQYK